MTRRMLIDLHPRRENARMAAEAVCAALGANDIVPVMSRSAHDVLRSYDDARPNGTEIVDDGRLLQAAEDCELIIVLGGDGTILRAAERFHTLGVPVVGINLGHVGFLAESESADLEATVRRLVLRDYDIEQRMALDITVRLEGRIIHRTWALNEATVEKGPRTQMIELSVGIDDRPVSTFGCDGAILATPTGSTAYAFSAGGPIVWPDVEALLMVPISAHALFAEPLVTGPSSVIAVEYRARHEEESAVLWCDGREEITLPSRAHIEACRSAQPLTLARIQRGPFTDRLVRKFQLPVDGWRGPAGETA